MAMSRTGDPEAVNNNIYGSTDFLAASVITIDYAGGRGGNGGAGIHGGNGGDGGGPTLNYDLRGGNLNMTNVCVISVRFPIVYP
jgi:hypothetical protein